MPYGQAFYDPIWEACERNGLVAGMHFGGIGIMHPPTSAGWPSYYLEWHTDMSQAFQAQVISLVCEGTFQKFPGLRFALLRRRVRLDAARDVAVGQELEGAALRVPLADAKAERDHRASMSGWPSQPIEEPDDDEHLLQIFEMMDAEHTLMFSSDYPHWDFDSPRQAFPRCRRSSSGASSPRTRGSSMVSSAAAAPRA